MREDGKCVCVCERERERDRDREREKERESSPCYPHWADIWQKIKLYFVKAPGFGECLS